MLAWRSARRAPLATTLNVLTLVIGLACFLTAYGLVAFWDRAEHSFPNASRTYVLTMSFALIDGSFARSDLTGTPELAAEFLRTDFPALEKVARALPLDDPTPVAFGERALRLDAIAVDPEFLDVFPLPFAAGDAKSALAAPRSAVIRREAAARLFGGADPLGRNVLIANVGDVTVTGVIDDVPEPSHLGRSAAAPMRFDLLVSMDVLDAVRASADPNFVKLVHNSWTNSMTTTYVLLPRSGFSAAELRAGLAGFSARHVPAEERATVTFDLMPVRKLLRDAVDAELFSRDIGVSVSSVLLALGALVLAVACLNYANLATARATRRVREVGVRKALGAGIARVALQHLVEAALLTAVAMLVALAAFRLELPVLARIVGADVGGALVVDPGAWLSAAGTFVAATLLAGAYPAFVLARLAPIAALRSGRVQLGARRLTALLVGVQFAAASLLLVAVTVISLQNSKLVRTGLGAVSDPLVLIENPSRLTKVESRTLRAELLRVPQVKAVSESAQMPWTRLVAVAFVGTEPDAAPRRVLVRYVGYDFLRVMDIPLLAGRGFAPEHAADEKPDDAAQTRSAAPVPVMVDRAFVAQFGLGSPAQAIDKLLYFPRRALVGAGPPAMQIVGVVENRRLTFRGGGAVAAMYQLASGGDVTYVRVAPSDVGRAVEQIDAVWSRLAPHVAIRRSFFDETFSRAYENFLRLNRVFDVLAGMALAISTIGLVGMAALVAARRRREIGVRKAFGASTAQIVRLLVASFSAPVLAANVVVWPIAYYAARAYLGAFLDPIALTPAPFAFALAATVAIAWLAVGTQTLHAARTPPSRVLRDE